jgi:hypothetical protein
MYGNAAKSISGIERQKQKWQSKWMMGFCGVGIMLKLYRYQKHSKCPQYMADNDDTTHVFQCTHPDATYLWNKSMEDLGY